MIDELTDDEAKELYAHFGRAFYHSNVLEHGVVNAIYVLDVLKKREGAETRDEWEALADKHFIGSFAKTLGRLKNELTQHRERSLTLASIITDLGKCVKERNFLAHHFWREHATHWFTRKGRESSNCSPCPGERLPWSFG